MSNLSGKGCLMPKYDSPTGTAKDLADELTRFRDVVWATLELGTGA